MRLTAIYLSAPAKENIRGTSALQYYLLKGQDSNVEVVLYSFNNNRLSDEQIREVEQELGVEIRLLKLPWWYRWLLRCHLLFFRVLMRYPFANYITLPKRVVEEIKMQQPDMIWVNGEELSRIVNQFPGYSRIQIGPDVESLYYYRMMGQRFVMNNALNYWKCAMMYRKYARLERSFCTDENFTYYAVGEADIAHLRQLNPQLRCAFLRHPHYEVAERALPIKFHQPKIRLLVAGQYNLYMQQTADEILDFIISLPSEKNDMLKEHYTITFLGKGWEQHVSTLNSIGYNITHIKFAPNYIEEIIKHDIQITPITIGTGTKGKVLDALANGLLVLGTPYAFENIAVEHGKSCIQWKHAKEVPDILKDIVNNINHYEQIASAGRDSVLKEHNPAIISRELFSILN